MTKRLYETGDVALVKTTPTTVDEGLAGKRVRILEALGNGYYAVKVYRGRKTGVVRASAHLA